MAISGKIEALNNAIREVVPAMRKAAEGNPEVQFYVRVIRFSTGATWHIAQPTLLTDFKWVDLHAEGETDLGQAFALLTEEMSNMPADARMLAAADRAHLRRQAHRRRRHVVGRESCQGEGERGTKRGSWLR